MTPLAADRFDNYLLPSLRGIAGPEIILQKFPLVDSHEDMIAVGCKKCNEISTLKLDISYGRRSFDILTRFVRNFSKDHKHLPVVEPPKVLTEQVTRVEPEGRKFRA